MGLELREVWGLRPGGNGGVVSVRRCQGHLGEELCAAPARKGWGEERSGGEPGEPGEEEMEIGAHRQGAEEALENLSRKREVGKRYCAVRLGTKTAHGAGDMGAGHQ